eukprot:286646_1
MSSLSTPSPSVSGLGQNYSIDTGEFVAQLWISVPIGAILMFLYCVVRRISPQRWEVRRFYATQQMEDHSEYELPKLNTTITYPRISTGFIRWVWDVWTMDTNTFYRHAGFDALVFRLYLKGCMYICLAALPYALCVLLPVYATSVNVSQTSDPLSILSLSTVSSGSPRLYAAVIG